MIYDVIVIGDDLSSHVAAAVAAGYGLSTALIAESGLGDTFINGDFVFNIDPTPITGMGTNQTLLALLAELDIEPIERKGLLLNPAYQIILPDHRVDFFSDKESLVKEITREFPQLELEINRFYDSTLKYSAVFSQWLRKHPFVQLKSIRDFGNYLKIIKSLIGHKLKTKKLNRILLKNPSLQKIWEAQHALLSFKADNQYSFSSSFLYSAPLRGIFYFSQGKQLIFNSLIKKIESSGGLYLSKCKISAIDKGRLISVNVTGKYGVISEISAKKMIVSSKWNGMTILTGRKKKINVVNWIRPVKIAYYPFTIHLGIPKKCLPEKTACHIAIVSDVNRDIHDNNLIILQLNTPQQNDGTSKDKIPMTATVFLPNIDEVWTRENLKAQSESIIDRIEFFLPFLKENIELFDIDKSIDIYNECRQIVNPKYQLRNSFFTGFAAKNNKTRFSNIYLSGASLLTDAGFEGEIISGINAASKVIVIEK
jgi:phytoene dehydrogenase-like protein